MFAILFALPLHNGFEFPFRVRMIQWFGSLKSAGMQIYNPIRWNWLAESISTGDINDKIYYQFMQIFNLIVCLLACFMCLCFYLLCILRWQDKWWQCQRKIQISYAYCLIRTREKKSRNKSNYVEYPNLLTQRKIYRQFWYLLTNGNWQMKKTNMRIADFSACYAVTCT